MDIRVYDEKGLLRLRTEGGKEVYALTMVRREYRGTVDAATGEAIGGDGVVLGDCVPGRGIVRRARNPGGRLKPVFKVLPSGRVMELAGPFGIMRRPAGFSIAWEGVGGVAGRGIGRGTPCLQTHDAIHKAEARERIPREAAELVAAVLFLGV